jgi:chaperonin GroES
MTKKELNITPLGTKVLISPQKVEEKTSGGLIVPPSASEDSKPETGVVVKLGDGLNAKGEKMHFSVKVGDKVFFKSYSPDEIEVEGEKYFLVDSSDILAII